MTVAGVAHRFQRHDLVECEASLLHPSRSHYADAGRLGRLPYFERPDEAMSDTAVELAAVRERLGSLPGWGAGDIAIEPAIPVLASPSWRGVDGFPWRATRKSDGKSLFIKAMDRDAALYIDVPCAFEAAKRASDLGIGPKVMLADIQAGILVMEDLNHGWRVGTLERMLEPQIVDAVLAARRRFQTGKPLPRRKTVFDEIEQFYAAVKSAKAQVPVDIEWLVEELRFAAAGFATLKI